MPFRKSEESRLPGEEALARGLRSDREDAPSAAFKARVRAGFLGQSSAVLRSRESKQARRGVPMTDFEHNMRIALDQPEANVEFRDELKRRFIDFGKAANRESAEQRQDPKQAQPKGTLFRIGVFAAAVAAALLVIFYLPEDARWKLGAEPDLEGVLVDGRVLDQADLNIALGYGAELMTAANALDFELSMGLRLRVQPDSRVNFLPLPAAGSHQELGFEVLRGEVFLKTNADYIGNPIRFETRDVAVMVTGTALGVLVTELGTCTCVEHGEVSVTLAAKPELAGEKVSTQKSLFVLRDGECMRQSFEDQRGPMHAEHLDLLELFAATE
jgi:ferric-dicitrate binding protein FerR (iron transport regulator)